MKSQNNADEFGANWNKQPCLVKVIATSTLGEILKGIYTKACF